MMHQFSTKNLAKAEFMMALAFRDREIDQHRSASARAGHAGRADPVHRILPRLPARFGGRRRAERAGRDDAGGDAAVDRADDVPENVRPHACEIIQTLGAGGLVAVPSYAETGSPVWPDVETYFQAANADSRSRIKLFRLAFDAAVSSFCRPAAAL